jgi:SAM-dependent methyltransferase
MRECGRVLKPGGRLVGYLIHTPAGLTSRRYERAAELGPAEVVTDEPLLHLVEAAGLRLLAQVDVTSVFRQTCEAISEARRAHEAELRDEEGDELFEEGQERKAAMSAGIDEGLLLRSLLVAERP